MKVTIITASYNSEDTILDTLISVKKQDYSDVEHIIIDGKSSDKTISIINEFESDNIKIFSEKDSGIYDALNKGINKATGDIIGFLHSDDVFYDTSCISLLVQKMNETTSDAIYGDLLYVSAENTDKIIRYWKSKKYTLNSIKIGWMPPHPTLFVKRKIYDQLGLFDTTYKISGDYELMIRFLYRHKINATYINHIITKMRVGGASNSLLNIALKVREDSRVMKKFQINPFAALIGKNISKIGQFFNTDIS
jgi:glycosyltransferase